MNHFPCEAGCMTGVNGPDVPNYVPFVVYPSFVACRNNLKPEFFQVCLTTESESLCDAFHATAARLCPCIPKVN